MERRSFLPSHPSPEKSEGWGTLDGGITEMKTWVRHPQYFSARLNSLVKK
jgi:hypothetical protein